MCNKYKNGHMGQGMAIEGLYLRAMELVWLIEVHWEMSDVEQCQRLAYGAYVVLCLSDPR